MKKYEWLIKELIKQYRDSDKGELPVTMEFDIGFLNIPIDDRKKLMDKLEEEFLIDEYALYGNDKARMIVKPDILNYFDDVED